MKRALPLMLMVVLAACGAAGAEIDTTSPASTTVPAATTIAAHAPTFAGETPYTLEASVLLPPPTTTAPVAAPKTEVPAPVEVPTLEVAAFTPGDPCGVGGQTAMDGTCVDPSPRVGDPCGTAGTIAFDGTCVEPWP